MKQQHNRNAPAPFSASIEGVLKLRPYTRGTGLNPMFYFQFTAFQICHLYSYAKLKSHLKTGAVKSQLIYRLC